LLPELLRLLYLLAGSVGFLLRCLALLLSFPSGPVGVLWCRLLLLEGLSLGRIRLGLHLSRALGGLLGLGLSTFGGFPVRFRLFAPFLACLLGRLLRRQLMFLDVSESHEAGIFGHLRGFTRGGLGISARPVTQGILGASATAF
jgi:hypothetical protein